MHTRLEMHNAMKRINIFHLVRVLMFVYLFLVLKFTHQFQPPFFLLDFKRAFGEVWSGESS